MIDSPMDDYSWRWRKESMVSDPRELVIGIEDIEFANERKQN